MEERRVIPPRANWQDGRARTTAAAPAERMVAEAGAAPGEETLFVSILEVVWNRRWLILASLFVCVVVAFVYLFRAAPIYESASEIYIERRGPAILGGGSGRYNYLDLEVETQARLIGSSLVLQEAIEDQQIRALRSIREQLNPLSYIKSCLGVSAGRKADVLVVSMRSPSPDDNAIIVNKIVEVYGDIHRRREKSGALAILSILSAKEEALKKDLQALREQARTLQAHDGSLTVGTDGESIDAYRLAQLAQSLTLAQHEAIDAKLTLDLAVEASADPRLLNQLIASEQARGDEIARQIVESVLSPDYVIFKRRYEAARRIYGVDHLKQRRARLELEAVAAEMGGAAGDIGGQYLGLLRRRFETARAKEGKLQELYDSRYELAFKSESNASQLTSIESDARRAERQLDVIYSRIQELDLNDDRATVAVSILEPAIARKDPVSPNRPRTLAIAIVFGLIIGVGGAYLREWTDDTIRSTDELAVRFNLPVLGTIGDVTAVQSDEIGKEVRIHPKSKIAEDFRTLRTAIHFGVAAADAKRILVTSPAPGDGKTTIVSNLALAFAQAGRRVLVLDCDYRKPRQHKIFGLDNKKGIASVLLGHHRLEEGSVPGPGDNLRIMPCGPIPSNPSELLNSEQFVKALDQLASQFDHIIIDSPPVLMVTDARILSACCDQTLVVVRAESSGRRATEAAIHALGAVGGRVFGFVVNGIRPHRGKYGYYGGYRYARYGYQYVYGGNGEEDDGNQGDNDKRALDAPSKRVTPAESQTSNETDSSQKIV